METSGNVFLGLDNVRAVSIWLWQVFSDFLPQLPCIPTWFVFQDNIFIYLIIEVVYAHCEKKSDIIEKNKEVILI